jgi:hypothetical protein
MRSRASSVHARLSSLSLGTTILKQRHNLGERFDFDLTYPRPDYTPIFFFSNGDLDAGAREDIEDFFVV